MLYKKRNERGFIHRATRIECTALSKPLQTRGKKRARGQVHARTPAFKSCQILRIHKVNYFCIEAILIEAQNELSFELILSEFEVV